MAMTVPTTATMSIGQYLAYAHVVDTVREHILAEHLEMDSESEPSQPVCKVCGARGMPHAGVADLLLYDHKSSLLAEGQACWVSDIAKWIRRTSA